ncbi:MAG: hypothetical protein HYZ50_04080 [Deltaproteobacteria bacterium]|nr:hypothetical protein [Deltaproteobacteria bacterium]
MGRRGLSWFVLLFIVAVPFVRATAAPLGSPFLVKDLNTFAQSSETHLGTEAKVANGTLFFFVFDAESGWELWKSDGSSGGTLLVRDLYPGNNTPDPFFLTAVNNVVFFAAEDGSNGYELWKSDGTAAGTVLVKDISPGAANGIDPGFAAAYPAASLNNLLFFVADDGQHGRELWKSDGTDAGTTMVKDIRTGSDGANIAELAVYNGTVFFGADDGALGAELWKSDGTAAGTTMVKDIYPGTFSSAPYGFVVSGGLLFLGALDGVSGQELWKTNGTDAGTQMVKDLLPGMTSTEPIKPRDGSPLDLTDVNGILYFSARRDGKGRELWKSDGSDIGTVFVKDIRPGSSGSLSEQFLNVNGVLFFVASDDGAKFEVWRSDGTANGTVVVNDIGGPAVSANPKALTRIGNTLFFLATDAQGRGLWKSDGTVAGTILVKYVSVDPWLIGLNGTLLLGFHAISMSELWKSDGAEVGTIQIGTWNHTASSSFPQGASSPTLPLLFSANGDAGAGLWRSNGTEGGTVLVKNVGFSSGVPINGTMFFIGEDPSNGQELWKSDGTTAGTTIVRNLKPGVNSSFPRSLTNFFGQLFFAAYSGSIRSLWKTDGSDAGTVAIIDLPDEPALEPEPDLTPVQDTLFFVRVRELWKTDGTTGGTVFVKGFNPAKGSEPRLLTAVSAKLFFTANDGVHGRDLWVSDGTEGGTTLVRDFPPPATVDTDTSVAFLTAVNNTLFFVADDGSSGLELWKSDGTETGTVQVKDIFPGAVGSMPSDLIAVNGLLFFVASDGAHGRELWKSDGTEAGTQMVKDIFPGLVGALPSSLTNANGLLVFAASDGVNGYELWQSDGSAAGTTLVADIAAGEASANPSRLAIAGPLLFFSAGDGNSSYEPWAVLLNTASGDSDGDGVANGADTCPATQFGCDVNASGCSLDGDHDGVCDGLDICANTTAGCVASTVGCSVDSDQDGVCSGIDICANTPLECQVDGQGCPRDTNGNGIPECFEPGQPVVTTTVSKIGPVTTTDAPKIGGSDAAASQAQPQISTPSSSKPGRANVKTLDGGGVYFGGSLAPSEKLLGKKKARSLAYRRQRQARR